MKPEPLENKQKYYLDAVKIHHDEDIKSAVEFLKESLFPYFSQKRLKFICSKIKKAFPDVIKK